MMRWLPVALSLFGAFAAAAKRDSFEEYHRKAVKSSPLKLSDVTYKRLTTAPRNHSIAVLLTALDARFQCQLCTDCQPEWNVLGRSWVRGDQKGESRTLFGTLDFSDGKDTFMSLGLQTAPVLLLFQPTVGPFATASVEPSRFNFNSGPPTAEEIHAWLIQQLPDRPHPPVYRPINFTFWGVSLLLGAGGLGVLIRARPYFIPIIQNRNVWAAVSIIAILMFTSGHMFNQIRKVPYVAGDGQGGISYFAGGFQSQFGMETQIIAFIYGILSFGIVVLTLKVPRMENPALQKATVLLWISIVYVMYAVLLKIFRMKNGGYPFSLPPVW